MRVSSVIDRLPTNFSPRRTPIGSILPRQQNNCKVPWRYFQVHSLPLFLIPSTTPHPISVSKSPTRIFHSFFLSLFGRSKINQQVIQQSSSPSSNHHHLNVKSTEQSSTMHTPTLLPTTLLLGLITAFQAAKCHPAGSASSLASESTSTPIESVQATPTPAAVVKAQGPASYTTAPETSSHFWQHYGW